MTVYVVNLINSYPSIDGNGGPIGVYSSEKKAKEAIEKVRPDVEYFRGTRVKDSYELVIQEFEMDLA